MRISYKKVIITDINAFEYYSDDFNLCIVYKNAHSADTDMFSNHFHRTHEIYYLRTGQRNFFIQGKLHYIAAPSLVIIAPNEGHHTVGSSTDYSSFIINANLNILPAFLLEGGDFVALLQSTYEIFQLTEDDVDLFDRIIKQCEEEINHKKCGFQLNIYAHIITVITQILNLYARGNSAQYAESMTYSQHTIREIMNYISAHYAENLSLEFLSNKFFISSWHLSRSFKAHTGMSLHSYINKTRLNNAKNILDNNRHIKLSVVAAKCGFKSESSFIRAFKNLMGITPHQYRKNKVVISGNKQKDPPV